MGMPLFSIPMTRLLWPAVPHRLDGLVLDLFSFIWGVYGFN